MVVSVTTSGPASNVEGAVEPTAEPASNETSRREDDDTVSDGGDRQCYVCSTPARSDDDCRTDPTTQPKVMCGEGNSCFVSRKD